MAQSMLAARPQQLSPPGDRSLGLPQPAALVVGSIIGAGIFALPYPLASHGPISILAMALATLGAGAQALMFAVMSRRLPSDGGPYAYTRVALRNGIGFAGAWSYWITAWAGKRGHLHRLGLLRPALRQQGSRDRLVAQLRGELVPDWGPFLMAGAAGLLGVPVHLAERGRMTAPLEL